MNKQKFCHLHVHNEYSFLDGYGTAKQYVSKAKKIGFKYLGLTNHGNIDGLIKFQNECDSQGISPILGCELYLVPNMKEKDKKEKKEHIILLVKNQTGWKELCRLLTKSNLEGFYRKPRLDYDSIMDSDLSGFVILTACASSFICSKEGQTFLYMLSQKMEIGSLYLEIMPHLIKESKEVNKLCKIYSKKYSLPLIATNDCHYVSKEDNIIQEILLAIQVNKKWNDKDRWSFDIKEGLHLRNSREMMKAFEEQKQFKRSEYLEAMKNSIKIAKKCCEFRILRQKVTLPIVSKTPNNYLDKLCKIQFRKLKEKSNYNEYKKRYTEEMILIKKKKFAQYFLIVKELVDWCKKNDIMVGAGRGSVGGSLVAYLLGITSVDPLQHGLLFSRFISEDRIDLPDIDIDFEDIKRDKVRQHLEKIYGQDNIAGVSTFLTMKGRGAIRDVGRVFDVPYNEVDTFAKVMTEPDDKGKYIKKFSKITNEGKYFEVTHRNVTKYAIRLEGQIKAAGQHAAAIVINRKSLTDGRKGNLCRRKNTIISNWDMEDSEYVGLMKLDILGLNTLSVLNETNKLVGGIDFEKIPLDNKKVFRELSEGKTVGVFQLSTYHQTGLCKRAGIKSFNDIGAVLSIARPGALYSGMTDEYILRKDGKEWKKKHKIYEFITKETYGCVIYQEQVMQIIHEMAGLDYSTADSIRKIISKKRDVAEFEQYKNKFIKGCLKEKTFSKEEALTFWNGLLTWANYGFNKSHAISYGMMAYWTAYCKLNYPVEFICASLTYGGEEKKEDLVKEAIGLGLKIVPPKIGISNVNKWVAKEDRLYIPFIEIKGIGEKSAEKCVSFKKKQLKRRGFFEIEEKNIKKTKLEKILDDIKAFDENVTDIEYSHYFSFEVRKRASFPKRQDR